MGRMLETLNQAAVRPEATAPVPPPVPIPEIKLAPPPEDDAIPYIEVGGSDHAVDASPQVLACPVPNRLLRPKSATPVQSLVAPSKTVEFRPATPPHRPAPPPTRRMAPELVAFHHPDDPVSEEYRAIFAALIGLLPPGRPAVILFTALSPWTGTTTVALNLAVTAARQEQRRVVVVDGNSRRPALAERLGLEPTPGWRDLASGTVPPEHSVQDTVQPFLHALTAGRPGAGVDHRVTPAAAAAALAPLRKHADLILIDAASWNEGDDVAALASVCDGVVVVLDYGQVGASGKIDPLPWLRQPPAHLLGCITTRKMTP